MSIFPELLKKHTPKLHEILIPEIDKFVWDDLSEKLKEQAGAAPGLPKEELCYRSFVNDLAIADLGLQDRTLHLSYLDALVDTIWKNVTVPKTRSKVVDSLKRILCSPSNDEIVSDYRRGLGEIQCLARLVKVADLLDIREPGKPTFQLRAHETGAVFCADVLNLTFDFDSHLKADALKEYLFDNLTLKVENAGFHNLSDVYLFVVLWEAQVKENRYEYRHLTPYLPAFRHIRDSFGKTTVFSLFIEYEGGNGGPRFAWFKFRETAALIRTLH